VVNVWCGVCVVCVSGVRVSVCVLWCVCGVRVFVEVWCVCGVCLCVGVCVICV